MNEKRPGEGRDSFPYFFLQSLIFVLALGLYPLPPPATAQKAERDGLSPFDRLAEEATLLNQRGQFHKVITLLEPHTADKKNDSALFFNELGVAYRRAGRLSEAIQGYQSALSRDPGNPVIMKNLGDTFYLRKEYPQAVEQYQRVLQSNPRFQQAHASLGLAYYQMQKYPEALEEFEIVLKLDPKDEQAQKFREAILKKMKSPK
jgi:tetratricopeptide (TPR) repeat protein